MKPTTRVRILGAAAALVLVCASTNLVHAQTYVTLADPVGPSGEIYPFPLGIDGTNIVGKLDSGDGFLFDGTTYTILADPLSYDSTVATGISGSNVVGYYEDANVDKHGFLYTGGTYSTLDDPLVSFLAAGEGTWITGISGSNIVGYFEDRHAGNHGFLYNGTTFTTLDDPLATGTGLFSTNPNSVDGNNIVGTFTDSNDYHHGFLYNGTTFTTLDDPLAAQRPFPLVGGTSAKGVSGSNIVGSYVDSNGISHGFLYNGSSYTTLDDPLSTSLSVATGISGNYVVGYYYDNFGEHGFWYTAGPPPGPFKIAQLTASTGDRNIALSWTASIWATSYNVYRGTVAGGESTTAIATGVTGTNYTNAGLTNGVTYYYTVSAVNSTGSSTASNEVDGVPIPPPIPTAPANLTATASDQAITLNWTASLNATGYRVYRGTTAGGESTSPIAAGLKIPSYTNINLRNGTTYYYTVTAVDHAGVSGFSNEAHAMPRPSAPFLQAVAGNTEVTLTWTASPGAKSYEVFSSRIPEIKNVLPIAKGITSLTYTDTGLIDNESPYYYKVIAVEGGVKSLPSNEVVAHPVASVPDAITNMSGNSTNPIQLYWPRAKNATSYNVYRGSASGAESPIPIATGITVLTFADALYTGGYYKVAAVNGVGTSGLSNEVWEYPIPGGVAINKLATADSSESGHPASSANDDDFTTYWSANDTSFPHWWSVDLGASNNLTGGTILFPNAAVWKFKLEVSPDNSTWTTALDETANTTSIPSIAATFNATGRYVRVTITGSSSGLSASLSDVSISE